MDITIILKAIVAVLAAVITYFVIPWLKTMRENEKFTRALGIVRQVVAAARELDITGELVELGTTKAEYAWTQAKALLASKNLTVDDAELRAYIKGEVIRLRIDMKDNITGDALSTAEGA